MACAIIGATNPPRVFRDPSDAAPKTAPATKSAGKSSGWKWNAANTNAVTAAANAPSANGALFSVAGNKNPRKNSSSVTGATSVDATAAAASATGSARSDAKRSRAEDEEAAEETDEATFSSPETLATKRETSSSLDEKMTSAALAATEARAPHFNPSATFCLSRSARKGNARVVFSSADPPAKHRRRGVCFGPSSASSMAFAATSFPISERSKHAACVFGGRSGTGTSTSSAYAGTATYPNATQMKKKRHSTHALVASSTSKGATRTASSSSSSSRFPKSPISSIVSSSPSDSAFDGPRATVVPATVGRSFGDASSPEGPAPPPSLEDARARRTTRGGPPTRARPPRARPPLPPSRGVGRAGRAAAARGGGGARATAAARLVRARARRARRVKSAGEEGRGALEGREKSP